MSIFESLISWSIVLKANGALDDLYIREKPPKLGKSCEYNKTRFTLKCFSNMFAWFVKKNFKNNQGQTRSSVIFLFPKKILNTSFLHHFHNFGFCARNSSLEILCSTFRICFILIEIISRYYKIFQINLSRLRNPYHSVMKSKEFPRLTVLNKWVR